MGWLWRGNHDQMCSHLLLLRTMGGLSKTAEDGNVDVGNVDKTTDKTNYTRQKAHVNMWNKADIRAVLLSCDTLIASFPRCLQNVVNILTFKPGSHV